MAKPAPLLGSAVAAAAVVLVLAVPAAHAAPPVTRGWFDRSAPLTAEEQRLPQAVPREILRRSGFDRFAARFSAVLCGLPRRAAARALVAVEGRLLWRFAVARAQGRTAADGLPRADDRPLYWARLELTAALRQWQPRFALSPAERADLIASLDRSSRGQDTIGFPAGEGVRRVLVTGFDPFRLDDDIRHSNPSGSTALALDGAVLDTPSGPARVETAMFPVLWQPFEQGMLEHALLPHLLPGPRMADVVVTVSQGRPARFDLERWNGRWHTSTDNDRQSRESPIPIPAGTPTVLPAPEFVPTTLPYQRIVPANPGPFPLFDQTAVLEIPAGDTAPVLAPDGPTPGSLARAGGGGSFLSNEIAYRTTLLRDAVAADIPAGHLHVPVLDFGPGNATDPTDPVLEQNRLTILDQTRAILAIAAGSPR
jgi:pyrrolidone-carboxylate peptidase